MPKRLIAVVDDDALVRAATGSLLRSMGFDCRHYASAEDLLADGFAGIDVVLSDIQMPGMTGIALAHALHERPGNPPTVLMTAYPDAPAVALRESGEIAALLAKPLDGEALLGAVQRALGR